MSHSVIVISIEGIGTSLVGAYGSSLADTPTLDSLAAHGIVLDQCFLDSRLTEEMLISLWSGGHALTRQLNQARSTTSAEIESESEPNLWQALEAVDGIGALVTDCSKTASLAEKFGCDRVVLVEQPAAIDATDEVTNSAIMGLFSTAAETLEAMNNEDRGHRLCWIHSKGLRLPWDAPIELRNSFKDADDPDPPDAIGPPSFKVTDDIDPDVIVGWTQAAAAQSSVLDQAIAWLRAIICEEWSWCFLGIDGCAMGEHGWVGCGPIELHDEQLQNVVIVCPSPQPLMGWRIAEVCQLPDISVTIAALCGIEMPNRWGICQLGEPQDAGPMLWDSKHQIAVLVEKEKTWIRTPAWACTLDAQTERLYVKPDDRWEASEISNRCQDVIEEMRLLADQFMDAAKCNQRSALRKLSELLCSFRR